MTPVPRELPLYDDELPAGKGTIAPGADADVVIYDPHAEQVLAGGADVRRSTPGGGVVDAIRYVNDYGVKWRSVPVDFGIPWRTVHGFFQRWRAGGDLARIHAELHEQVRVHDGPECAMSQVTGSDTGTSRTRTSEKHGG